jgi:hypothetical protein
MAKWAEIKCERCAETDALWEGMERALEESDAREARLEAKLAKAVEALKYYAEHEILNLYYDDAGFARDTLAALKGQDDEGH